MVDEIKALIDTKFEEQSKKIDSLQDKIDANHNGLQIALEKTDQKVQKAIDQGTENQEELKHLEERYNKKQNLLNQLEEEIEDLKNRSLRATLIF